MVKCTNCMWITLFISTMVILESLAQVIWRCPEFDLLRCKTIPKNCVSYRMIYIRHGHLECPGCLICADLGNYKPWTQKIHTTRYKKKKEKLRRKRRRKRRRSRRLRRKRRKSNRVTKRGKLSEIGVVFTSGHSD